MDQDAFLPLRDNELSPEIGRRQVQYQEILDEVVNLLAKSGIGTKGKRSASTGYYGTSFEINGYWLYLEVSYWHWRRYADTPFWIVFTNDRQNDWPTLTTAFARLRAETPSRLIDIDDFSPAIPLHVPTGVEKDEIIAKLVEQIREVASLVPLRTGTSAESSAPGQDPPIPNDANELPTG